MEYDYTNKCTLVVLDDLLRTKQLKLLNNTMTPFDIEMNHIRFEVREKIKRAATKNNFPSFFEYNKKKTLLIAV